MPFYVPVDDRRGVVDPDAPSLLWQPHDHRHRDSRRRAGSAPQGHRQSQRRQALPHLRSHQRAHPGRQSALLRARQLRHPCRRRRQPDHRPPRPCARMPMAPNARAPSRSPPTAPSPARSIPRTPAPRAPISRCFLKYTDEKERREVLGERSSPRHFPASRSMPFSSSSRPPSTSPSSSTTR